MMSTSLPANAGCFMHHLITSAKEVMRQPASICSSLRQSVCLAEEGDSVGAFLNIVMTELVKL